MHHERGSRERVGNWKEDKTVGKARRSMEDIKATHKELGRLAGFERL
jgi:hypothetical protein